MNTDKHIDVGNIVFKLSHMSQKDFFHTIFLCDHILKYVEYNKYVSS